LWGAYDGVEVLIDLSDVPEEAAHVFVLHDDGHGKRLSVPVSAVQLRRVTLAAR
jgi:hypothetical protein